MAVDFDALDLVRGENKSRLYNKRLDHLQQQVVDLQELVEAVVRELPEDKRWSFEERLKKLKKVLDIYPIRSYVRHAHGQLLQRGEIITCRCAYIR